MECTHACALIHVWPIWVDSHFWTSVHLYVQSKLYGLASHERSPVQIVLSIPETDVSSVASNV